MKAYKIYGEPYPLQPNTSEPADSYAIRGKLVDEQPKGKVIGYVQMEDGSIVECYKKSRALLIILIVVLLALLVGGGILVYLLFVQKKDVAILGNIVKVGSDNNVVTYNGVPSVVDGKVSIQFTNGDYPAAIQVVGEGVQSDVVQLEPAQFINDIPCKFTTEEGVVEALVRIKTETSTQEFPIVIEIPENFNSNDIYPGQEGFWSGEQIYGPE